MTTPAHQPDNLAAWLRIQLDTDAAEIAEHPDDYEYEAWDLSAEMETNYPCLPYLRIGKRRALAEVDAKRRLLDWLERRDDWATDNNLWTWDSSEALSLLALPYAERSGYRSEWRP